MDGRIALEEHFVVPALENCIAAVGWARLRRHPGHPRLERTFSELGFRGALVNGYSNVGDAEQRRGRHNAGPLSDVW